MRNNGIKRAELDAFTADILAVCKKHRIGLYQGQDKFTTARITEAEANATGYGTLEYRITRASVWDRKRDEETGADDDPRDDEEEDDDDE